jgi:hypothetical protein
MDYKDIITRTVLSLLAIILVPGGHYLVQIMRAKVASMKLGKWNQIADHAFDSLDTFVTNAQPLVEEMKEASKTGKLTQDQIDKLKNDAVQYASDNAKKIGVDLAQHISEDVLSDWVTHIVEARKNPALNAATTNALTVLAAPPAKV